MDGKKTRKNQIIPIEICNEEQMDKKSSKANWSKLYVFSKAIGRLRLGHDIPQLDPALLRSKKLEDIFNGKFVGAIDISTYIKSFTGILLSALFATTMTIWPQHNIINDPKYWYEAMLVIATGYAPIAAANIVFSCFYCMGIEPIRTIKPFLFVYLTGVITTAFLSCFLYVVWVYLVKYPYPMPFQGYLVGFSTWHMMTISLWFQIPFEWRQSPEVRRRSKFAILLLLVISITELSYKIIRKIFLVIPQGIQWTLFILLIGIRELHGWMLSSLGQKVAGFNDKSIEVVASHFAACRHTLFLAVALSTVATNTTSYVILGVDFFINIGLCIIIMYLHKTSSDASTDWQVGAVMNLVINESVEFIMPIGYTICFLCAYYGPNAAILGNIQNGYWQYSAVTNLEATIGLIATMFFIDFGSTIISFLLLRVYCKINIIKMYMYLQKEMWHVLCIHQCYLVEEVSSKDGYNLI